MLNNDILRRFRYAVDLSDTAMTEIFLLAGVTMNDEQLRSFFCREHEDGYLELSSPMLEKFLDGLIVYTRGPSDQTGAAHLDVPLNNNVILKKMRIALQLRDSDLLNLFAAAEYKITKSELSALFRKKGHKNYKECGDQILRNFLVGLTKHNRQ